MARYVRTKVELGTIEITQAVANSAAAEHQLLFMPGFRPPLESLYRHGVEPLYRNRLESVYRIQPQWVYPIYWNALHVFSDNRKQDIRAVNIRTR